MDQLDRDELYWLLREQVFEDDDFRRRLQLRAAAADADLPTIDEALRDVLRRGLEFGSYGYIDSRETWRYARRVREATAVVYQLVAAHHEAEARSVAECALAEVQSACRNAKDISGMIGEAAAELVASHFAACAAAGPAPEHLADFLAELTLNSTNVHGSTGWRNQSWGRERWRWAGYEEDDQAEHIAPGIPHVEFEHYADLLGRVGLARLRERFKAAWQKNPAGLITRSALERVLRVDRDVDALVTLFAANLDTNGRGHLQIARELDLAGRQEEALAWAERGMLEASEPDPGLADFVVMHYQSADRAEDAVAIRRAAFEATPSVLTYDKLRTAAELAGIWPANRQWAISVLRANNVQELVDVLIAEGNVDGAWEAALGVATQEQWLRLADLVAETRPTDALTVYLGQVERLGEQKFGGHERMVHLLVSAQACHQRLGTRAAFESYMHALREAQKRNRKLIRLLNARSLP